MRKTVVLAEDLDIVREGLRLVIDANPGYEVVGEAENGEQAVRLVEEHEPDIVLMDILMPVMDGPEATAEVKRRFPRVKVLILTANKDGGNVFNALNAGADGYVYKKTGPEGLFKAMSEVLANKKFLCPEVSGEVIQGYLQAGGDKKAESVLDLLTERERQVLRLVAGGHSNPAIAEMLSISVKTVDKHKGNLTEKLGLDSRSKLGIYARGNSLFD